MREEKVPVSLFMSKLLKIPEPCGIKPVLTVHRDANGLIDHWNTKAFIESFPLTTKAAPSMSCYVLSQLLLRT